MESGTQTRPFITEWYDGAYVIHQDIGGATLPFRFSTREAAQEEVDWLNNIWSSVPLASAWSEVHSVYPHIETAAKNSYL